MREDVVRPEASDQDLAAALEVLSNPVRIALLRSLRQARSLKDIRIAAPSSGVPSRGRGSMLARQTVRHHLDRLARIDLVVEREVERDYGPTVEYILNHRSIYAVAEVLRDLARLRAVEDLDVPTVPQQPLPAPSYDFAGPCLVLVKGLDEGRVFKLDCAPSLPRTWTVGRRRTADVPLDFDPYVSASHAEVRWDGLGFALASAARTRNPTTLNLRPVPASESVPLRHGDLVGVGRSLLLFRS